MRGQWIGRFASSEAGDSNSYDGQVIVNVDDMRTFYEGVAYLLYDSSGIPSVAVNFTTSSKSSPFSFSTNSILAINPATGIPDDWDNVKDRYGEGAFISSQATITGSFTETELNLGWSTNRNISGRCSLSRSNADADSVIPTRKLNWAKFKRYVETLEDGTFFFRGQNFPWRLRTSFHRHGRADVGRFARVDIPRLHQRLSAHTRHVFNLDIPVERGAFVNLARHHGYPTPILDWTRSPYVAAFFAFRGLTSSEIQSRSRRRKSNKNVVRIIRFDQKEWTKLNQLAQLEWVNRHFSVLETLAIDNERMTPQQSASTVTNVDDVESYLMEVGKLRSCDYLEAIDLPVGEADTVLGELRLMGITAGSMFPGLDGACEEMKERMFFL